MDRDTERNKRVQARYDALMAGGKHGHYETMFKIVREEVEAERVHGAVAFLTKRSAQANAARMREIRNKPGKA